MDDLVEWSKAYKYFNKSLSKIKNADDIKLVDELCKDTKFITKIDNLKPRAIKRLRRFSFDEIRSLKQSWDFDLLLKGKKNIDDLLSVLWKNKKLVQSLDGLEQLDLKVAKTINDDVALFKSKKLTSTTKTAQDLNKYYDIQIKRLESFKSTLNSWWEDSINIFNKLDDMWVKPRHMADLFEISSKDVKLFDEFKLKLNNWDSASYLKYLNEKKWYKILDDTIDQFTKIDAHKLLKNWDEAFEWLFKLVKFCARVT